MIEKRSRCQKDSSSTTSLSDVAHGLMMCLLRPFRRCLMAATILFVGGPDAYAQSEDPSLAPSSESTVSRESEQSSDSAPAVGTLPDQAPALDRPLAGQDASSPVAVPMVIPLRDLDRLLSDGAEDLGLNVQHMPQTILGGDLNYSQWESELGRPDDGYVNLGAVVEQHGEGWRVRVTLALPDGTLRSTRSEVAATDYELPLIQALRQLVPKREASTPAEASATIHDPQPLTPPSNGRGILAVHGALLGGYVGFTLENAGGAAEARLVYPLMALGAGVGLAASLIVAEEWDVTRAEAWYVSAGALWLTGSAILISSDLDLMHPTDRYSYGLVGTAAGLGLSGIVTSRRTVSEAEALFAHSGGLLGLVAGGLVQRLVEPTDDVPRLGMGLGSSAGLLIAGLGGSALLPNLSSSRVLFADLGALLGGLAGAAVATPILVGRDPPDARDERVFVASALGGLALGTVVGYWFGRDAGVESGAAAVLRPHIARLQPDAPPFSVQPALPASTTLGLHGQW